MSDDSPSLIESFYCKLRAMGQAAQLRDPFNDEQLVARFEATVNDLYSVSAQGPFFPGGSRTPLIELAGRWKRVDDRIANSAHLQALLWRPPAWRVADRPDLDFEFLGREITPMSSVRGDRRVWLTDKSERRLRLDALLVNCADRTPIVAEFKIGDDQNAELALVQALAAAAQLSAPSQLKRLHIEYRDSLGPSVPVRLDVYVITYRARERGVRPQLAQRAKSRVRRLTADGRAFEMDPPHRVSRGVLDVRHPQLRARSGRPRLRGMTSARDRAWSALSERLRTLLSPSLAEVFIGGTHARRFADNLLPGLSTEQIETIRDQLALGAGGELKPTNSGKRRAHAPYSSAALTANAFGRWIRHEHDLQIAGLGGFDPPLRLEHKLRIAHRGGEANLDCVLSGRNIIVGIESKLTETLEPHRRVPWSNVYRSEEMASLLDDRWRHVLESSLSREWVPEHLGLEQLIKHALALSTHAENRATYLVYCYWEPLNADTVPGAQAHRRELAELRRRVGEPRPRLETLTYDDLWAEWSILSPRPPWVLDHLRQLRDRYELEI